MQPLAAVGCEPSLLKGDIMTGQSVTCPSCRTAFKLDESLAAPLIAATRKEFEQKLAAKDTQIAQREATLHQPVTCLAFGGDKAG